MGDYGPAMTLEDATSKIEWLQDLLKRTSTTLHQITEDTDGIWTYLAAHSMTYSGAQYGDILKEIDEAIGVGDGH